MSEVTLIGGRPREVHVDVDPARLAAASLDPLRVARAIEETNARSTGTGPVSGGGVTRLQAGNSLERVDAMRDVVVSGAAGRSVLLRDVAVVTDEDAEPVSYVRYHSRTEGAHPAVTISVAKRKGANAITVAHLVEQKLDTLRGVMLPRDLTLSITRNYGETAAEKANELLYHMFLAVISVTVLIGLALGRREAAVVLVAIPVTLALTLFAFAVYGYTLNRITLFALIFSIGILVDDAIVVVENVVRHARMQTGEKSGLAALTVRAVDEVGNPTILATLTVVAAILPMAFVGGLMGPYMRPIPIGATAAMLFSLAAAFIVTPWAAVRLLRVDHGHAHATEGAATRLYRRAMARLIDERAHAADVPGRRGRAVAGGDCAGAAPARDGENAPVRQQERIPGRDRHAGRDRARADRAGGRRPRERSAEGSRRHRCPELRRYRGAVQLQWARAPLLPQTGAAPGGPAGAITSKDERREQSHDVAKRVRQRLLPIAARFNATIQVSEVPPGPPVLQTLVAEIYGPDAGRRMELAQQVKKRVRANAGRGGRRLVRGIAASQDHADRRSGSSRRAAGVSPSDVAAAVRLANDGMRVGLLHDQASQGRRADRDAAPASGSWLARKPAAASPRGNALGRARRVDPRDGNDRRRQSLSQEPSAGDLRHGRPRWCGGEPGVRHSADEPGARAVRAAGRATPSRSSTRSSRPTPRNTR